MTSLIAVNGSAGMYPEHARKKGGKSYRAGRGGWANVAVFPEFWKTGRKLYKLGILVYFAAAGIQAVPLPSISDWLSFMGRHTVYAFAWPIIAPIEINLLRREQPAGR